MNRRRLTALSCALCCIAGLILSHPASDAKAQKSERLYVTGTIVGVGGRFGGRTLPFTLTVNRYTSPDDVVRLNTALQSGGQDELLKVLSGLDAGRFQIGSNVGVTANAVISTPQAEGGTKLTVIFQRTIRFFELRYGSRSEDYRFGYAEIFLGRNNKNEGTFIPAARINLRGGNTWEVEDFGEFPARLIGVRVRGNVNTAR
jgi:hypothetical protein